MTIIKRLTGAPAVALMSVVVTMASSAELRGAQRQVIHYQIPRVEGNQGQAHPHPPMDRLNLAIGLPLRNREALTNLLRQIYDPTSLNYHHYLRPGEFTERFGPRQEDYDAVIRFAQMHGLRVNGTNSNRMLVAVKGTVLDVERAFNITIYDYPHPKEPRRFHAPDREPSIDLAVPVLNISGLDDYMVPRPAGIRLRPFEKSITYAQGSGPGGNYMGYDFRAAYAPGVSLTGVGQAVGLFELDGYYTQDIAAYEGLTGLPEITITNILLDGFSGGPGPNNVEVALDIDMAMSMAPGLSAVMVYEGTVPNDVLNRMAADDQANQLSASWGYPIDATTEQIFQEYAAQGQSFFNSSGDSDAYPGPVTPPSDDPNITIVGGTTLTMSTGAGAWASEIVWNWDNGTGSSGGISTRYAIPGWQQGVNMSLNQGSTTMRNIPDVAMVADNVWLIAFNGESNMVGGTSISAPLWAGFTALANQLAVASGLPTVGFLNPTLYSIGEGPVYDPDFHDITTGSNTNRNSPTAFFAVPGYDLCTGWGTPTGNHLIEDLVFRNPLRATPITGFAASVGSGGPFVPTSQPYTLTNAGTTPLNWMLVNTSSWLTVSPETGTLVPGGPAGTATVCLAPIATNLAPGSYSASILFSNINQGLAMIGEFSLSVVTPPVITMEPANIAVPEGMTVSYTVGTGPNALLLYQWQLNGSNLTDNPHINGSSSGTLTIENVSPSDVGIYSVIVSNVAGTISSSGASLTIVPSGPVFILQPGNQTAMAGVSVAFAAKAAGDMPLSYQWSLNGTNLTDGNNLTGSATSKLTISDVAPTDGGTYAVSVSNALGSATSTGAVLTVISDTATGAVLTTLHAFSGGSSGGTPYSKLTLAGDGTLYGTTYLGGAYDQGTAFKITTNGAFTMLASFNGRTNGANPRAGLLYTGDGFYGVAQNGGTADVGTVFSMSANGVLGVLHSFNTQNSSTEGVLPNGDLAQGRNGDLFGTTVYGGADEFGTVFRISAGGTYTFLTGFGLQGEDSPYGGVIQSSDGNLYGTTYAGGQYGKGCVFKLTTSGTSTMVASFNGANGQNPISGLTVDGSGNFYGTTYGGGTNGDYGVAYELTTNGTLKNLHSFTGQDGLGPVAGLTLDADGILYGTTSGGGTYGDGTLFRILPDGSMETLAQFNGVQGADPEGALVMGPDGNLYGTTAALGPQRFGTVFKLAITAAPQLVIQPVSQSAFAGSTVTFRAGAKGTWPLLFQWRRDGTNLTDGGNISGSSARTLTVSNLTTADAANYSVIVSNVLGSTASTDAVLQVSVSAPIIVQQPTNQTVTSGGIAVFSVGAVGNEPLSYRWQQNGNNLTDGGNLGGTATSVLTLSNVSFTNVGTYAVIVNNALGSATSGSAMLYLASITAPGVALESLFSFTGTNNGANPRAGLIQGQDGLLYGTASAGGAHQCGTCFRMTTSGIITTISSFDGFVVSNPHTGLIQGGDGNLYGTSSFILGGQDTVYRLGTNGTLYILKYFQSYTFDGNDPEAKLIKGADGNFYSTCLAGGTGGVGDVYRISPTGTFAQVAAFSQTLNGELPHASLWQGIDGNFYGTASYGGSYGHGTVYKMTPGGSLISLVSFAGTNGANPYCGVVQDIDGNFYGATQYGGATNLGTLYRMNTNGLLTTLHSFSGGSDGSNPMGDLVRGSDGNFYGTTDQGGIYGDGTVFQLTTNGTLTTLVEFNGFEGANPEAPLMQANDGSFYGTTKTGGGAGLGTVFRLVVPLFVSHPFFESNARDGLAYQSTIATNAIAPSGDTLSFRKVSGPAWLGVAANGNLSGVPGDADIGTNFFVVGLIDTNGWSSSAAMYINVTGPLSVKLQIAPEGSSLLLRWTGGQGPFQVLTASNLANPDWQSVSGPISSNSFLLIPSNAAAFYRIQSQ